MATNATANWDARDTAAMQDVLRRQRAAFTAELPVTAATRKSRLSRALAILLDHRDRLVAALSEDFGHRSTEMSLVTDIMSSVKPIKHAMKHLAEFRGQFTKLNSAFRVLLTEGLRKSPRRPRITPSPEFRAF